MWAEELYPKLFLWVLPSGSPLIQDNGKGDGKDPSLKPGRKVLSSESYSNLASFLAR
ncbi:hypothetical protein COLO4_02423 [Corchorus olitorius]|uniref:Uncharacterized protein n=1 Tax=Corchorus olitorius TaxID=93759 RepID=A0A1R3L163_9ROSI|nr:hypothetical protein COLO4_02423 [Corchorus olitorius]